MASLPVPFRYEYLMAETIFSQVRYSHLAALFVLINNEYGHVFKRRAVEQLVRVGASNQVVTN